ncbi:MAG TPA: PQQ-binding-like beta-propeller repeat protein, partial [Bryobacteraceae bacterium]|nr:PQQ-binding-like beta-propeller repeat protein [Bryobacteraceae bacterium]
WLFAPYYGPPAKDTIGLFPKTHGPTVNGQLMAFTVEGTGARPKLVPQWVSADLDLPGVAVIANGVILILANGDRGATLVSGAGGRGGGRGGFGAPGGSGAAAGRGGRGGGRGAGRGGRGGNPLEASVPGNERDTAWRAINTQKAGQRYSGGRDTTHAVLYALDPQTGDELYSSGDAIDSWNHYGGIAVSDGVVYLSSWDARIYALGIKR